MSQIQAIKDATDIVNLIGSRISLQRSGTNFKGLCPFHSEKSPSFFVSETMQRFRCFGCSESGDVYEFLQKYDGMSFYESLEYLADQAGIKLEKTVRTQDDEQREQLLAVLNLAKEYYHFLLTDHKVGALGRTYLEERGTTAETRELFQLGVAPAGWDGLLNYLCGKKKYAPELLEDAGLVIKGRGGRYYDRFRNRLIFPLKNHRGQVVGFSGRLLSSDAEEAKYINSPETKLYHKSEMLFGYHELYQQIRKAKRVIVVEGEFDVLSSVQAHVDEVVAIKGSALTEQHITLLKRAAEQIILALDTDAAGVKATQRAIEMLQKHSVELRVIRVPEGKDPDDLARSNPKEWREVSKQSVTAYEFLISAALQANNAQTPEGKRRVMQALSPVLARLQHAVELEHYIKELATALSVSSDSVRQDIERTNQLQSLEKPQSTADSSERRGTQSGNQSGNQPGNQSGNQPGNQSSASSTSDNQQSHNQHSHNQQSQKDTKRSRLEKHILFLLLKSTPETIVARAHKLVLQEIRSPGFPQLLAVLTKFNTTDSVALRQVLPQLPEDVQQFLFTIYSDEKLMELFEKADTATEWKQLTKELQKIGVAEQKQKITQELSALDEQLEKSPEDEERQNTLLRELVRLNTT
jgi:DNA primase